MKEVKYETHPFTPFIPTNAKVLMLGTFPPKPDKWCMDFYYPNKINDMWRILGLVFFNDKDIFWNNDTKSFKLPDIINFLNENYIGLYDTAYKVNRLKNNASDKFLDIIEKSPIDKILSDNPSIDSIITTGEKATDTLAEIFNSTSPKVNESTIINYNGREIVHFRAPSSSRAYPLSLSKKAVAYATIFKSLNYKI